MDTRFTVKGVELELDIFDADQAERLEAETKRVVESVNAAKGNDSFAESIRAQCNAVFAFFNNLFGEGTASRIFGGRTNLMECLEAFEEAMSAVSAQRAQVEELARKYQPGRAQRRAK